MQDKIADLHIHSYYSDGTMSPEDILSLALNKGVGLIAIADHDILDVRSNCKSFAAIMI